MNVNLVHIFDVDNRRTVFMNILRKEKIWTIFGTGIAIFALLFSAYTFYESSKLAKRTMIAELVLDTHEKVYEFLAQVNQFHSAQAAFAKGKKQVNDDDPIHPEIRLALVRAEGAIARAQIIGNEDIQVCLVAMHHLMGGLVESSIPSGKDFSVQEYVLEMDAFPDMVRRYLSNLEMAPDQKKTQRNTSISECGPMEFALPEDQNS